MFVSFQYRIPDLTVTTSQDTLQNSNIGFVPVVADTFLIQLCMDLFTDDSCTIKEFFFPAHWRPLEWGKWLWNKERSTCCDLTFSVSLIFWDLVVTFRDFFTKMSDTFHIILGFGRKSEHKIQFHFIPAALKSFSGTFQNHFPGQTFVDHITQSLGTGFRCKCQAALFDILYFLHNIQGERINSKRWKGNIYASSVTFFHQEIHQFREL